MDIEQRLAQHASRAELANGDETCTGLAKMCSDRAKMVDRDQRQIRFVVSNATVDRDGDIVEPDGWQLDKYLTNPVVFWAHRSRELPVAQSVSIGVEGDALVSVAQFASAAANPMAEHVFQCYAEGCLRAVSAGFRILAAEDILDQGGRFIGMRITQQELWEYSAVGIPANPDALMLAGAKGVDLKWWQKWAEEELDEGRAPQSVSDAFLNISGKGIVVPAGDVSIRITGNKFSDMPVKTRDAIRDMATRAADMVKQATAKDGVTNFPEMGDDSPVTLASSAYPKFPAAEAEALRVAYPDIWAACSDKHTAPFDGSEDAIRMREEKAPEVMDAAGLAGVVDCVRLRVVHSKGIDYMRATLRAEKDRIADAARKSAPVITIDDPKNKRINVGQAAAAILAKEA
jgi:HK97 family phage prohead protease